MRLSATGIAMIKFLEAAVVCRRLAYKDQGGVWTIGWGSTGPDIVAGTIWTQEQCDARFAADSTKAAAGVDALIEIEDLTDNEFSALVSFAYNEGLHALATSHLLALVNQLDGSNVDEGDISAQFNRWDKVTINHELVTDKGLVGRRACEIALWNLPDGAAAPDWNAIRSAAEAGMAA